MAQIISPASEAVYQIKKWLGVNEAQEGEASLKMGEAAVMRNFKVTDGGALMKRAGSRSIAGLMSGYTVEVDTGTTEVLLTEALASTASLTMYPGVEADALGNLTLTGEPVSVGYANRESYIGYYYRDENGGVHRFAGIAV